MTYDEWLRYGLDNGYCGAPVCITHDGYPTTEEEDDLYADGDDVCLFLMRPYGPDNEETRLAVEENHPPSVWRK